jgi:outer membrane protein assembly factor BamB
MQKIITGILLWLTVVINGQIQVKIPWPSLADSPWPYIRGDMQCTGRSEYTGPSTDNVIWRKDMPLGIDMGPVIGYEDNLYLGELALSPDSVNYFYAVNKNGEDLWTFPTTSPYANLVPPTIDKDSIIYFGSGNLSIYALDYYGTLKWELKNSLHGRVIGIAKNHDLYIPGYDTLWILDHSGFVKNKVSIPDLQNLSISFSTGGDTIFYYTGPGLYPYPGSLNAATLNGDLLWSYDFATNNQGAPLVDNQNKIYVFGTDSIAPLNKYIYCINPDGTLAWRYKIPGYHDESAPTMDKNGNIIFQTFLEADSIWYNAIASLDYYGNLNWITPLRDGDFDSNYIEHGLVCDAEGKIYCGSQNGGNFYCLNNNGEILWRLDMGEYEFSSSPAIGSDGTLYIGTHLSSLFQNHVQNLIAIRDSVTSVHEVNQSDWRYSLLQNFPNPFNSTTHIRYTIPEAGRVILKVFDTLGKQVALLIDSYQSSGEYDVIFQPANLSSGIYFYQLHAGEFISTEKLILLK